MTSDRGQALVITAALLGVAASAIAGSRAAADRLVDGVRDARAGEAAAAAAGTAVSDLIFERWGARDVHRSEVAAFVADPAVRDLARAAANALAREHRRVLPTDVRVLAFGFEIEVHVRLAGRTHIALLTAHP